MQRCWREQWPGEASHGAADPHGCTCNVLLPRNTASTTVIDTAIKHTQVAKSNLSTAICTVSNHCNHIFVETWKIGLEGTSRGPSALPCPRASCSSPTHPWSLLLPKRFLSQNFSFLILIQNKMWFKPSCWSDFKPQALTFNANGYTEHQTGWLSFDVSGAVPSLTQGQQRHYQADEQFL